MSVLLNTYPLPWLVGQSAMSQPVAELQLVPPPLESTSPQIERGRAQADELH